MHLSSVAVTKCTHNPTKLQEGELSSDDESDRGGNDSDHEEELAREELYRAKMLKAREKLGKDHDVTIKRCGRVCAGTFTLTRM
jgi:hypothetical protein